MTAPPPAVRYSAQPIEHEPGNTKQTKAALFTDIHWYAGRMDIFYLMTHSTNFYLLLIEYRAYDTRDTFLFIGDQKYDKWHVTLNIFLFTVI